MKQQTAVEWFADQDNLALIDFLQGKINEIELAIKKTTILQKAKEMEKEHKIKEQIEILRKIGNNGKNAPLYGILKDKLIILEEQLTKL